MPNRFKRFVLVCAILSLILSLFTAGTTISQILSEVVLIVYVGLDLFIGASDA